MPKQTDFFATKHDLVELLNYVERTIKIKYALYGPVESGRPVVFDTLTNCDNLGIAKYESYTANEIYLVFYAQDDVRSTPVNLLSGDLRYSFSQKENPDSIVFRPSAMFDSAALLKGQIDTLGETARSRELFSVFNKAVKKLFRKINGYYVGPDAERLSKQGIRLTLAMQSPKEFDLKVD